MNRYLKLANFEFNRVAKVFSVLLAIILVSEMIGVIVMSKLYLAEANHALNVEMQSKAEFLADFGPMSMIVIASRLWFLGPIALCVCAVAFYIFMIWYRDWFGKNTFIYRLLMLPTARMNVFFAKMTTILLMTFGFVAFQLILLPIESMIFKWMVPEGFRHDLGIGEILTGIEPLGMLVPNHMAVFLLYYGGGITAVSVLFTLILLERSYRLKGIFIAAGYSALAIIIFLSPVLIQEFVLDNFFYQKELLILMILTGLVVLIGSIWMSKILLKKKITV